MRKTMVIAAREYQAAVRTKAFVISIIMMPILMGGSIVMQLALRDRLDLDDKRVQVIDLSVSRDQPSPLVDALVATANDRNSTRIFRGEGVERRQIRPRFTVERAKDLPSDPAEALLDLSERVRRKELFAFIEVGPDTVKPGSDKERATVRYFSNNPTYDDLYEWLDRELNSSVRSHRFQEAGLNERIVAEAIRPVDVANLGLVSRDESGRIVPATRTNRLANFMIPFAMLMLMFMVVMVGASPLTNSVIEEKMQRIAEVLLGSVTPTELMLGKLLGCVGVSLTLLTVYIVGSFAAAYWAGQLGMFPIVTMWWFVLYLILAVLLFGSMFAAVGAAVSDLKEAQSALTPLMLLLVVPMMLFGPIIQAPSSKFATVVSLIPPFTPLLMPMRQSIPPGVPVWQPVLGVLLALLFTLLCVWAAGRIFRVGLLMQGRGAKVGEMLRWIVSG